MPQLRRRRLLCRPQVLRSGRLCNAAVNGRMAAPPACSHYPRGSVMRIEVKNFMVRCRNCGLQPQQAARTCIDACAGGRTERRLSCH